MSTATQTARPPLESILLFWRTHGPNGVLPSREQSWWFTTIDENGGFESECYDPYMSERFFNLAECVVDLAEQFDICIGEDQVYVNTVQRRAEWNKGA